MSMFRKLSQTIWHCYHHIVWVPKYRLRVLKGDISHKVSVSSHVGAVKGLTAIRVLNRFRKLRQKSYWGNHFWVRGYRVDTVGLDTEMIQKYVKYQENQEKKSEKSRY